MKDPITVTACQLRDAAVLPNNEADTALRASQHVDETINAEKLNLAADQVADSRLRYAKQPCCLPQMQRTLACPRISVAARNCASTS